MNLNLKLGFPTGSLLGADRHTALQFYRNENFVSAEIHPKGLRDPFLKEARNFFPDASIHLPSYLDTKEEDALLVASEAIDLGYRRLVIHPNIIRNPSLWKHLGANLLIENLDFRFPGFITASDMKPLFQSLPEARFCLDLAHTYGSNPGEAVNFIECFADRLAAIHYSEIDRITGNHLASVSDEAMSFHATFLKSIDLCVPLIFEVAPSPQNQLLILAERFRNSLLN